MTKMTNAEVLEILSRMRQALNVKTDAELCRAANFASGQTSTWKARNNIPDNAIHKVASESDHYFEWIKNGTEPRSKTLPIQIQEDFTEFSSQQNMSNDLTEELLRYFNAQSIQGKKRTIHMAKGILLKELQE